MNSVTIIENKNTGEIYFLHHDKKYICENELNKYRSNEGRLKKEIRELKDLNLQLKVVLDLYRKNEI